MKIVRTIDEIRSQKYECWRSQWQDPADMDCFSYISDVVHPEDVLLFCTILFPNIVLHGSGVFLEMFFSLEAFSEAMRRFDNDIVAVESSMNHMRLYDVFGGCRSRVDDVIYEQLSKIVAQSWRMVLQEKFPERKFCVEAIVSDQEYGPVVTFSQVALS